MEQQKDYLRLFVSDLRGTISLFLEKEKKGFDPANYSTKQNSIDAFVTKILKSTDAFLQDEERTFNAVRAAKIEDAARAGKTPTPKAQEVEYDAEKFKKVAAEYNKTGVGEADYIAQMKAMGLYQD